MKNIFLLFFVGILVLKGFSQTGTEQVFIDWAVLHGDSIVFPLTLINAFPFITTEVNGIKGKFMFDTGSSDAIELNDHYVKLPPGKPFGKGTVGSGQTFSISEHDTLEEVKFENGLTFKKLLHIKSENLDFLQDHITLDCLGYIGYDFFKGYLFKLDYLNGKSFL